MTTIKARLASIITLFSAINTKHVVAVNINHVVRIAETTIELPETAVSPEHYGDSDAAAHADCYC